MNMDILNYATNESVIRTSGLWGGEYVTPSDYRPLVKFSRPSRFVTIKFENAHKAISFAYTNGTEGAGTWEISFTDTIHDFTSPVVLAIALTPHSMDICFTCGGCGRNTCETHRLCYC